MAGAGANSGSERLAFRAKPEMVDRIDAEARGMGVNRSAFIRMLIQQGMGDPTALVVLRETYYRYQQVSRKLIGQAVQQTNANLEALILDELQAMAQADAAE